MYGLRIRHAAPGRCIPTNDIQHLMPPLAPRSSLLPNPSLRCRGPALRAPAVPPRPSFFLPSWCLFVAPSVPSLPCCYLPFLSLGPAHLPPRVPCPRPLAAPAAAGGDSCAFDSPPPLLSVLPMFISGAAQAPGLHSACTGPPLAVPRRTPPRTAHGSIALPPTLTPCTTRFSSLTLRCSTVAPKRPSDARQTHARLPPSHFFQWWCV